MRRASRLFRNAVLVFLGVASPALAQQYPLGTVPGQTAFQSRMGDSINLTCIGLANAGVSLAGPSASSDLFARCSEMVVNAVVIETGATVPGGGPSLGLTAPGLNSAILQLSDQTGGAVGPNSTQAAFVQVANLKNRVVALRDGDSGFSIAGLQLRGMEGAGLESGLPPAGAAGDAAALPEGLGVFLTGQGDIGHYGGSDELLGFNYYDWGVTGGVDYRFTEDLVAGLAFGWVGSRSDFTGSQGDLESDAYVPSLYGSYTHGGWYADAIFSYAYSDFDLSRRIVYPSVNRTATGDTHANEFSFSVGGGHEFDLKEVVEGLTAGPRVRFDYLIQDVASFDESGASGLNLSYRDYQIESIVSVVGFDAAYALSTSFGVVTPQLRFDWNHEFAPDPARIEATFLADPNQFVFFVRPDNLDRDFFRLGFGVAATLPHGVSTFIDWETILDYDAVQNNAIRIGARYEF